MSINLLSGDIFVILEKHPCDVLVNFTDTDGNALSQLGKRLFKFYPAYEDIVSYTREEYHGKSLDGEFAYKSHLGNTLVAAFMQRLPEDPIPGANEKLTKLFTRLSSMMMQSGEKSIMISYYGATTGLNFADFLTLCEDTFDPSIQVNVVTIERIAKYCQLPHYDYPATNKDAESEWVIVSN